MSLNLYEIYHHQIHREHIKRSSIETPEGVKTGHNECQQYMEYMMRDLLKPVHLDHNAQQLLLDKTPVVFSDEDRVFFSSKLSLEEVKESVWKSNGSGSPGCDGFTSLFYKDHWDTIGSLLYSVCMENFERKTLSQSQATGLITFCPKPKKGHLLQT